MSGGAARPASPNRGDGPRRPGVDENSHVRGIDAGDCDGDPVHVEFDRPEDESGADQLQPADELLVSRTVRDIDARTAEDRDVLLSALLSAAWPAPMSQMQ